MIYYIRSNKELIGFKYNEEVYYYIKNNQDDIIGILDSEYNIVSKSAIASVVGLKSTSQLFNHSLQRKPSNAYYGQNSDHATAISNSQTFKDEMRSITREIENGKSLVQRQIRLEDNLDLYFAYHNITINATPKENGTVAHILIKDKYDFEYWTFKEHGFASLINNVGYALQQFGIINNYDFTIQFDYMLYPTFKSAE